MDHIKRLREHCEDLISEAQKILDAADREDRDLTQQEQIRWDQIMNDGGELDRTQAELEAHQAREATLKANAKMRRAQAQFQPRSVFDNAFTQYDLHGTPIMNTPTATLKPVQRTAFKDDQTLFDCAMWLRASLASAKGLRDEQATSYTANRFGHEVFATHTEGGNAGYLVPAPLSATFVETMKAVGVARNLCDVRPMSSDTLDIPKLVSGNSVVYPGEAESITPNDQTWSQLGLTAKKRAVLTKVSNELAMDSVMNVLDQLVSRLAYEFAKQQDAELISGDGTSSFGGELGLLEALGSAAVYNAGGATNSGVDTWPELTMSDFTSTMGLLPSEFRQNLGWLMSRAFYHSVCLRLASTAGGSTLTDLVDGTGNARPAWLGYPVAFSDEMPMTTGTSQVCALFGAWRDAVILGDRLPLEIAFSDQRYFDEDVLAVRAVSRYDLLVHEPGSASAVGAYTALKTSAT